tara:strand:- start:587 stop:688 length:102 start_codon:yes stop_codon:yes gene_type:complete
MIPLPLLMKLGLGSATLLKSVLARNALIVLYVG